MRNCNLRVVSDHVSDQVLGKLFLSLQIVEYDKKTVWLFLIQVLKYLVCHNEISSWSSILQIENQKLYVFWPLSRILGRIEAYSGHTQTNSSVLDAWPGSKYTSEEVTRNLKVSFKSLVIRQKGESSNGGNKKTKHANG